MGVRWLIVVLAVLAAAGLVGCGGAELTDVARLLGKASEDVAAAKSIEASFGVSATPDVTRAQNLLDDANSQISRVQQQQPSPSDSQQADSLTGNLNGVQSAIDIERTAEDASSSAPTSLQDRVNNYVYKTATTKVCQQISTALMGQVPASPTAQEIYAIVQTELGPSAPPEVVQLVADHVASAIQREVDRINAFIQANPTNGQSILNAALAYYNCLPSTASPSN